MADPDDNITVLSPSPSVPDLGQHSRPPTSEHRRRPSVRSQRSYNSQKSTELPDEHTSLLEISDTFHRRSYASVPGTPRPRISRHHSTVLSPQTTRKTSRAASFTQRLTKALSNYDLKNKRDEPELDERVWYDQVSLFRRPCAPRASPLTAAVDHSLLPLASVPSFTV